MAAKLGNPVFVLAHEVDTAQATSGNSYAVGAPSGI